MFGNRVFALLASLTLVRAATYNVTVSTGGHAVASTLYGMMISVMYVTFPVFAYRCEILNAMDQSGDGGLYAELLQNRAFQQVTPGSPASLTAWAGLNNDSQIVVVAPDVPVSSALPNALALTTTSGTTSAVGITNSGYFGINVQKNWTYHGSFYFRFPSAPSTPVKGVFTVGFLDSTGNAVAKSTHAFTSSSNWQQITFRFTPSSTPSGSGNLFYVQLPGAAVASGGGTVQFGMLSCFPPTFKNRVNGMRMDISNALKAMNPSFFRFPGGNNLEGQTASDRWIWSNTVGNIVDRPGRKGDWGYPNTDGLGLYEYLLWIEDMGIEPIMAVWAGFTLDGTALPASALAPYIQEAINQIEFAIGDASTNQYAAIRASMGHPAPFALTYIEIGNEDFFDPATYDGYRWTAFYNALNAQFPQLKYIATSATSGSVPAVTGSSPQYWDLHEYNNPNFFTFGSYNFDYLLRNGLQFFQGEYAVTTMNNGVGVPYPFIDGSIAEAAYMTGFDRNSDIVFAAAYAPLLNHVSSTQWTPNLITHTPNSLILSTSYYVQQMFGLYTGDTYLNSTTNVAATPVQWSVTKNTKANLLYLKAVNTGTSAKYNRVQLALKLYDLVHCGDWNSADCTFGHNEHASEPECGCA
ncbi:unnamed protein product [Mycena citricolor]|uniref:non-reducing end alpha-L-arabinofuranosidase n=1 Tax=Mycena citricolor TaxID=2018698 RepID=A0AAD2HYP1_9AGAR|nr:unnamed protein product [Mycena citricolor]